MRRTFAVGATVYSSKGCWFPLSWIMTSWNTSQGPAVSMTFALSPNMNATRTRLRFGSGAGAPSAAALATPSPNNANEAASVVWMNWRRCM